MLFKVTLAALLLVDAGIRLYYERGRREFEKAAVKHERREKFFYALVSLGLLPILFYVLTPWLDPFYIPIPPTVRWTGGGIIMAGDLLFIGSHRALGKNWSLCSHLSHWNWDIVALSANWIVALAYLLPVTGMYLFRVSDEEAMMIEQFGDEYRDYMQRTGRLVPKLSALKKF